MNADALFDLAGRVRRLQPSRTNPEGYFEEKDAICSELRRIAKAMNGKALTANEGRLAPAPDSFKIARGQLERRPPAPIVRTIVRTRTVVVRVPAPLLHRAKRSRLPKPPFRNGAQACLDLDDK